MAWQNFRKARYLRYAEKLFWFMAKVLAFVIYKWSASNEDFLKSSWIRQSSNLNFPPLEYVSDFEPGSHADQWQWSKVWVNQSQCHSTTAAEAAPSTTHKWINTTSGGKYELEHLLLHQDFRKSSFEAVVFEIAKPRTFAMNQNIFSAYQRHLAFPKFRHAFQKWLFTVGVNAHLA